MKTSFRNSPNPELSGITLDVLNITHQSLVPDISNNPLVKRLKETHIPFHAAVLREPTTKLGRELSARNSRRMTLSNSLRSMLRQATKFSNSTRAEAATAILGEWDKLRKPSSSKDYDEVNAYMSKLLPILQSEALAPHFETLGFTDTIADVEAVETGFQSLYLEQTIGNAELRRQGSATQHRPPVEKALGNYLKYITVMRDQPGYDVLYSKLNEAVKTARKASKKQAK